MRQDRRMLQVLWIIAVVCVLVSAPATAEPRTTPASFRQAKTWFQTNLGYDPRIAIATDAVVVHRHGDSLESMRQAIGSWKSHGFLVGRMFFSDSDASNAYWKGKWDGKPHEDEVERDSKGNVVQCGDVRPYMLPTEGWARYLEEQAMIGIEAGADAILPEEPLAHSFTGYEDAFKPMFERRFGMPWQPENASSEAHFLTCQLKTELYHDLEQRLARLTKEQASRTGRDITFALPVHALYSNLASRLVAPLGSSTDIRDVDGYVGQVWTGPVNWCTANYSAADKSFFASAYALYDYFAALTAGTGKKMWLLADPVEDDPNHKWSEFQEWYRHCLVAKLMFPEVDAYEVMPWPDRVFLPGFNMGGSSPAPESYRISLLSAIQVLQEVGRDDSLARDPTRREAGSEVPRGIGVAVGDSVLWEPLKHPVLDGVYSLILPLINHGVPVTACLAERWMEPQYLDRFRVIVLSYENFKPTTPEMNAALAKWVEKGGVLVVIGAAGELNGKNFWWTQLKQSSALHHLLSLLKVDPGKDGNQQAGKGWVMRRQSSPRRFADRETAKKEYLPTLAEAIARAQPAGTLPRHPGFHLERGSFIIAHALGEPMELGAADERLLDVLDPDLPVISHVRLEPGQSGVYRDLRRFSTALHPLADPCVMHCTHRLIEDRYERGRSRFVIRGPAETPAVVRYYTQGMPIDRMTATSADGHPVKVDAVPSGDSILIRFPNVPAGAAVEIRWGDRK